MIDIPTTISLLLSIRRFLKDEASVATATYTFFIIIFVRFKTYATLKTVQSFS